jgi:nucleoside-diphosphate kinase
LLLLFVSLTITVQSLETIHNHDTQEFCRKEDDDPSSCTDQIALPSSNLRTTDMAAANERTFIMVKPDGVQRGLVGEIIRRFEQRGFKLVALKLVQAPRALLENHYEEHKGKKFYEPLLAYISSGPVVAMVWEGLNVVSVGRKMLGATDPAKSEPGTIRGDFAIVTGRNIAHGSDSEKSAKREIDLWFRPDEVAQWTHVAERWIYE